MQQPLEIGTVLQNRYCILEILGQGGFGRTYLAEDREGGDDRCVLKELIPVQTGAGAIAKSKELFEREATVLSQLRHPQIPEFLGTFEQDGRLFLVQEYVGGKTYRMLLEERRVAGVRFSEMEVRELLTQLLPVLADLHDRGIIHRDITPENIMIRQSDRLPVLLDFGVVKELVYRWSETVEATSRSTIVGKVGYAPKEQFLMGLVYPSSDLYALAVTALVLLTGENPQQLFDEQQMRWQWQDFVTVTPQLGGVLNRMLSYQPGDRFPNAREVLAALGSASSNSQLNDPHGTELNSLIAGQSGHSKLATKMPPTGSHFLWDNPWAIVGIGLGVVLVTGTISWVVVSAIVDRQQMEIAPLPTSSPSPSPTPTPLLSPTPTPTPVETPTPTQTPVLVQRPTLAELPVPKPEPITYEQVLNLIAGVPTSTRGNLKSYETIDYVILASEGQQLKVYLSGDGVLMTVLAPNWEPVDGRSRDVSLWEGTLPTSGQYTIKVRAIAGLETSNYQLDVNLSDPVSSETETPPTPQVEEERISFAAGTSSTQVKGNANPNQLKRYLLDVRQGQIMSVEVVEGDVSLTIRYPDGRVVEDAAGVSFWQAELSRSGDYQIEAIASQSTEFALDISVEN